MDPKKPAYFDLETVALLRETLDDAWACLRPQERATMSRTQLAEGILALAAEGERNPDRLLDAALMAAGSLRQAARRCVAWRASRNVMEPVRRRRAICLGTIGCINKNPAD